MHFITPLLFGVVWLISSTAQATTLSSHLQRLQSDYQKHVTSRPGQPFRPVNNPAQVLSNGMVMLTITVKDKAVQDVRRSLEAKGMTYIAQYKQLLSGLFPLSRLNELENVQHISWISSSQANTLSSSIKPRSGMVINPGDTGMFGDVVKKKYNVDGSGVTIGVISDSYDCLGTAALDIQIGDLPKEVKVLKEFPDCSAGIVNDEGRAMMQLIHDIAPGAKLIFYTGFVSAVDMADGIQQLANAGANVIVDDIGWLNMPMFQDDPIAQSVDEVVARGVSYFSAAGNSGRLSYQNLFVSGTVPNSNDTAHDFGKAAGQASDFYQHLTIPKGTQIRVTVQWDDASEIAGGEGAKTDLDVFLMTSSKKVIAASSSDSNIGHDGIEFLNYTVPNSADFDTEYYLYISHRAGPTPNYIKYIIFAPTGIDAKPVRPESLSIIETAKDSFSYLREDGSEMTEGEAVTSVFVKSLQRFFLINLTTNKDVKPKSDDAGKAVIKFNGETFTLGSDQARLWYVPEDFTAGLLPNGDVVLYPKETNINRTSIDQYSTQSSTLFGHANSKGAIGVGAISYSETPWFNTKLEESQIEPFSSAGGTPILFDPAGKRLPAMDLRPKPEFIATDDIDTTFFPLGDLSQTDSDNNGLPNFKGTSAAAPNAAAIGALMLQAYPFLTPATLKTAMMKGSLNLTDPVSLTNEFPLSYNPCSAASIFDWSTGCGLLNAPAAFEAVGNYADNVVLSLRATKDAVRAFETMDYQFKVFNNSNQYLDNVRIRALQLPTPINYDAILGCESIDLVEQSCRLGTIAPKQQANLTIRITALSNDAKKLKFEADLLSSNNFNPDNAHVYLETAMQIVSGDFNQDGCVDRTDMGMLYGIFRNGGGDLSIYDLTADQKITLADIDKQQTLYSNPDGAPCR